MRFATSSEGPRLVRIAMPYAQIRVAIEMHSQMNGMKHHAFQEACSTGHVPPSLERSERQGLLYLSQSGDRFDVKQSKNVTIAVVSSSSCCSSASSSVVYEVIGAKFVLLHTHCSHTAREMIYWIF